MATLFLLLLFLFFNTHQQSKAQAASKKTVNFRILAFLKKLIFINIFITLVVIDPSFYEKMYADFDLEDTALET